MVSTPLDLGGEKKGLFGGRREEERRNDRIVWVFGSIGHGGADDEDMRVQQGSG